MKFAAAGISNFLASNPEWGSLRGRAAPEWLRGGKTPKGPQDTPDVGLSREGRRGRVMHVDRGTRE